jgi:hypothetical protein
MQKLSALVATFILLVGCNVQTVDVAQPAAAADKFYGALKSGKGKEAFAQYSPEFKVQASNWSRLLGGLQQQYGPVTSAQLQGSSRSTSDGDPCYSLNYAVRRGSLASNEVLFLCSREGNSPWLIRGHGLTRLDTQQTFTGGIGINIP